MNTDVPIEPERRVVTILYADIVGSTRIISELDPDDAAEFLDPAINKIIRSIHNFGGTVARVQGDGVKAVFGATHTQEDHAMRAALAGLEMVNLLQAGPQRPGIPRADLRIGMHSGYVIVRWQKNDLGGGLDTVGSTGHVAAKIEQCARPNHVTLSETTADLLKTAADFAPIKNSEIEQDGKTLKLFEINSMAANPGSTEARNWNLLPLVGRAAELERLNSVFENGFKTDKNRIYVVGDAGIGKSRLVREVSLYAAKRNVRVEITGGVTVYKDTPYYVLRTLVSKLLRLSASLDDLENGEFFDDLDLSERERLGLSNLVSKKINSIAAWDLPVDDKLAAIQSAVVKVVTYVANHSPLLIIAEDLHDIDLESVRCLEFVIKQCQELDVGLIATTRPVGEHLAMKLADERLSLPALQIEDSKSLIKNEITNRKRTIPAKDIEEMVESIINRSDGLPLALMEFSKLVSANPETSIKTGQMPLALEPLIHRKFDTLSTEALTAVQYASALGHTVDEQQLKQTAGLSDVQTQKALAEILEKKILRRSEAGVLSFDHHLYQEICYDSMVRNRKQLIHAGIYDKISNLAKISVSPSLAYGPQILAHHAEKAGLHQEALDHLWQACTQAIATSAIRTAQNLYHRAAAICDQLGDVGASKKLKFATLVFDALHQLAAHDETLPVFLTAKNAGFEGLKPAEEVVVRCNIATILWISGDGKSAYPEAQEAIKLAREIDYLPVTTFAEFTMANIEFSKGLIKQCIDRLTACAAYFQGDQAAVRFGETITLPGVMSRAFASWYAVDHGDIELATKFEAEAREIAKQENHGYSKTLCDLALGYRLLRTGEFQKASKVLVRAYKSCIAESFFGIAPMAASWAGQALIWAGDIETARTILEGELALNHIKSVRNSGRYYLFATVALLKAKDGDYKGASQTYEIAMQVAEENDDPVHQAYAYYGQGHLFAAYGNNLAAAKKEFERALQFARDCEMEKLVDVCKSELKRIG